MPTQVAVLVGAHALLDDILSLLSPKLTVVSAFPDKRRQP